MNSHKQRDEIFDISLRRSLKNFVARKNIPAQMRDQLLEAAAKQEISLVQRKYARFDFVWSFLFQEKSGGFSSSIYLWIFYRQCLFAKGEYGNSLIRLGCKLLNRNLCKNLF